MNISFKGKYIFQMSDIKTARAFKEALDKQYRGEGAIEPDNNTPLRHWAFLSQPVSKSTQVRYLTGQDLFDCLNIEAAGIELCKNNQSDDVTSKIRWQLDRQFGDEFWKDACKFDCLI